MNSRESYLTALSIKRNFIDMKDYRAANAIEYLMTDKLLDRIPAEEIEKDLRNGRGYISKMIYVIDDAGNPVRDDYRNDWIEDMASEMGVPLWRIAYAIYGQHTSSDGQFSVMRRYKLSDAFGKVVSDKMESVFKEAENEQ